MRSLERYAFLPISGQFLYPKIAGTGLWICMGPLNHMRDVGRLRRVGEEHVLELSGGHSRPHGQSEDVDDFRSLST